MTPDRTDTGNEILAALPLPQLDMFMQSAESVTLDQDESLGAPGHRIVNAHFILDGFVALLAEVDDHQTLAVDLVGSEGMLGLPLMLGVHTSALRSRVHGAGSALRIGATQFRRVLEGAPALVHRLQRYASVRLARVARTALCASFHSVDARLACWLLMAHDRAHGDRFYLTHDRLARALGVRRSGVTTSAGVLQARQWISYTRGHVVVIDRAGLESAACNCYREVYRPPAARGAAARTIPSTVAPAISASARQGPPAPGSPGLPAAPTTSPARR